MLKDYILLLPSFVCLHSAITLLIHRKRNSRAQNIWMLCMFAMSVTLFIWAYYYGNINNFKLYYKLDIIDTALGLSLFPFIRLYFKTLTDEEPLGWKEFCWFLPSLLIGTASLILCLYMGEAQAAIYMQALITGSPDLNNFPEPVYKIHYVVNVVLYYATIVVQFLWVMIYTMHRLVNHQKRLNDFLSNPDEKSVEEIRKTLIAFLFLLIAKALGIAEFYIFHHQYPALTYSLMFIAAGVFYNINYYVLKTKYTVEDLVKALHQTDKEALKQGYITINEIEGNSNEDDSESSLKKEQYQGIIDKVKALLDSKEIFLKKDLRLNDIVHLSQVNRTYISLMISKEYQCSFSEVINRKRIDYAKSLAISDRTLSHAQIADMSGFSHASSFSRTFKQYTGTTFSEWQKKAIICYTPTTQSASKTVLPPQ